MTCPISRRSGPRRYLAIRRSMLNRPERATSEKPIHLDTMYLPGRWSCSLTRAATYSRKTYPHTPLRLYVKVLATTRGAVSASAVAKQVQVVLTDRTALTEGRDFGVLSPLNWRMADLEAKHAFLRAGLGWGHMPKIRVQGLPRDLLMPMRVVFRKDALPGPAARAFIAQLKR